uniref:hypothetical protein n=1 Tax=Collinsella sp. BA40 TaxID=2560852 RepID=UPI00164F1357|nr:hypothetical protein [Collinsella sp. BA40]
MARIATALLIGCVVLYAAAFMPGVSEPARGALLLGALFCSGGNLGALWAEDRSR